MVEDDDLNNPARSVAPLVVSSPSLHSSIHSTAGRRSQHSSPASTVEEGPKVDEAGALDINTGEYGRRMEEHQERRQRGNRRTRNEDRQTFSMNLSHGLVLGGLSRLAQEDRHMVALEERRRQDFTRPPHPLVSPPPPPTQQTAEKERPHYLAGLVERLWDMLLVADSHEQRRSQEGAHSGPQATDTSSTRESMRSVDSRLSLHERICMAVLQQGRRRDFTFGSRHPLEAPPPSIEQVSEEEEEEKRYSLVYLLKKVWEMPWVADPIVSTMVIPKRENELSSKSWYMPRERGAAESVEERPARVPVSAASP
jgi:hypothetical protein